MKKGIKTFNAKYQRVSANIWGPQKRKCFNCGEIAVIEEWGFMKLTRPNGEELYEGEALYSVCENCDTFSRGPQD